MLFDDDSSEMTPEARLAEIASILAAGYLRVRRAHDSAPFTENPLDCSSAPMAVCDNGLADRAPEDHAA
jgi:hypothetical protein